MTHLTSAMLSGLGAVFVLVGLLFDWASNRAFERALDDPQSGIRTGNLTRGSGGCSLFFIALGLWGCAAACLVVGVIVYFTGH
jgi:hypothetical protein